MNQFLAHVGYVDRPASNGQVLRPVDLVSQHPLPAYDEREPLVRIGKASLHVDKARRVVARGEIFDLGTLDDTWPPMMRLFAALAMRLDGPASVMLHRSKANPWGPNLGHVIPIGHHHGCPAQPGEFHHESGCDVERCMWTGRQLMQCELGLVAECCRALRASNRDDLADQLAYYHSLDDEAHDCGRDVWTGEYPGSMDARENGLWVYWGPPHGEQGWVVCDQDHPGARPDLNALVVQCRWDRHREVWVKR